MTLAVDFHLQLVQVSVALGSQLHSRDRHGGASTRKSVIGDCAVYKSCVADQFVYGSGGALDLVFLLGPYGAFHPRIVAAVAAEVEPPDGKDVQWR